MAAKKSAQYPYQWPNGSWHSKPAAPTGPPKGITPEERGTPGYTTPDGGVHYNSVPAPQPVDQAFEASKLSANRNVSLGNADATYQTGQINTSYGYKADGSVDLTNPYSQSMQLQDSYKRGQLGTTNSMAAQGQLYSGANVNAQATNDRNYAQGDYTLRQGYGQAIHGVQAGQLQNYANNATGVSDADFQALLRAFQGG